MTEQQFQEQEDKRTYSQFITWASSTFSIGEGELRNFMKAMEVLHGRQPIQVNKTLCRVKYAEEIKKVGEGNVNHIEFAAKNNITYNQMVNMTRRAPTLSQTVNWTDAIQ
jgi:hypothetical protein